MTIADLKKIFKHDKDSYIEIVQDNKRTYETCISEKDKKVDHFTITKTWIWNEETLYVTTKERI